MTRFAEVHHQAWIAADLPQFEFTAEPREARAGTRVDVTVRPPLPRVIGRLVRPLLDAQVRKGLRAAVAENIHDLEVRGYVPRQTTRPVVAEAA